MSVNFPRPALPPIALLSVVTLSLMLAVAGAVWFSLQGPWLGLTFKPDGGRGVEVVEVAPRGPLADKVVPGDHFVALRGRGEALSLRDYISNHNPHAEATFQNYTGYMRRQGEIARALTNSTVTLVRDDGTALTLKPARSRSVSSLPLGFWLLNLFGILTCLIGLSVWVFRPSQWPARLLALSGGGFFLATLQHSVWEARELALPTAVFEGLMRGNHLALHLLLVSLMILMMVYPRKLRNAGWLIGALVAVAVVLQVNEKLQGWDLPFHTFYLPLLLYYVGGVALTVIQWRHSRYQPLDRGALRWVFLSIMLAMGGGMVVYFLPTILGLVPMSSLTTMVGIASTLYVGFALGILRYQLFQLERWWFIAWAWFLGGLSVLLVDLLVISVFDLRHAYALSLSLIAIGWLYFPVRQWFWRRFSSATDVYMERHLPGFVEALFTSSDEQVADHWKAMLHAVFQPLSLEKNNIPVERPELARNGALLLVPAFGEDVPGLKLLYGQNGRRLFGRRDRDLAQALNSVASRICNLREARQAGANQERKRIMRDLHDDVGGRLLSLMHTACDSRHEALARGALSALRETIYALDENRRYNLEDMLEDFRSYLEERTALAELEVDWQVTLPAHSLSLPPRYFINVSRVMNEAVSNALQHGAGGNILVFFHVDNGEMLFQLENDLPPPGMPAPPSAFRGRGLNNMRTRIDELGGEIRLFCRIASPSRFCLCVTIPLPG